jgi:HAE1 family hydrophobic/amphiphilic exporter-1
LLLTVICAAAASLFHDLAGFGPVAAGLAFAWGLLIVRGGGAARFALPAAGAAAVLLALLLGARAAGPLLRFRFAPGQDQGRVAAVGELPAGASLEKTLAAARQVERAAAALPEVESVLTSAGLSATESWGLASIGPQYFSLSVKLRPKRGLLERCLPFLARDWGRVRSDAEIADDLRARVGDRPGVNVKIAAVSSFYAVGRPLQVDIVGSDVAELGGLASRVLRLFRETPGVLDPDVSLRAGAPEQRIVIDRVRAASLGIPPADVAKTLYVCLEGDDTNVYREDGIDIPIRVRLDEAHRRDARELGGIVLESAAGAAGPDGADRSVVLADVARIGFAHGPVRIDRMDREKMVSVTANVRAGFAPGNLQLDLDRRLRRMDFLHSRWKWDGENRVVLEEGRYIAGAMLLAVALVYTLMAALFDSLLHPFVIMLSLPQALVGALLALALTGYPFSIVAMVGIIMLVGLVTKNAILLVDYTNTLRERGLSRTQALIEAGPTRLRPILMTTIAMISGMLPTALGLGRGAEFRAPLAIPVIGGLILSTALTLLVIPCLYTYADDAVRLLVRKGRFRGEPCESPVD